MRSHDPLLIKSLGLIRMSPVFAAGPVSEVTCATEGHFVS